MEQVNRDSDIMAQLENLADKIDEIVWWINKQETLLTEDTK